MAALSGAPSAPVNLTPFCYNFRSSALPKWKRARAGLLGGNYRPRIAFFGDSTTAGTGSLSSGALTGSGLKLNSYPYQLAKYFAGNGFGSCIESVWGDLGYGTSAPTYDTRMSVGSWAYTGSVPGAAGAQSYFASAATATPLSFTPSTPTDTIEIYYFSGGSTGSFNANVNGGTNTLKNTSGAAGVGRLVLTATLGSNTYNTTWASGGNVFIAGFLAYNSATKQVDIANMGVGGVTSGGMVNTYPSTTAFLSTFSPDLTVVQIGANDWFQSLSVTNYASNLQTMIAAAQANSDVLMISPLISGPNALSQAAQQPYLAAFAAAANQNNAPYIDINSYWTSYATATGRGFYASDSIHGTYFGYGDEALQIGRMLLTA